MKFFDVFREVKLNDELTYVFNNVEITKVTQDSKKEYLNVYILSDRIIPKEDICKVEEATYNQQVRKLGCKVRFFEKFNLSDSYDSKRVYEVYKDSILYELRNKANVDYRLFCNAETAFVSNDELEVVLEENMLSHCKADEIKEILEAIFNVRCGMNTTVTINFKLAEIDKYKDEKEHKINMLVENISKKLATKDAAEDEDSILEVKSNKKKNNSEGKLKDKAENDNSRSSGEKTSEPQRQVRPIKRSDNPDCLYGKDVYDDPMPIKDIVDEIGDATIRGKIIAAEGRELRNGKYCYTFDVTDFTDTISCKLFCDVSQKDEVDKIKKGLFVKLKGNVRFDNFVGEITFGGITGIMAIKDFTTRRQDNSLKKRVELHCHTKMSDSDGVSYAKDIIKCAHGWGMDSIAITDHGVVQAFPDANHCIEDLNDENFKVLYGMEGYVVDDLSNTIINYRDGEITDDYVVFDINTTGYSYIVNHIIELSACRVVNGEIIATFDMLVNPHEPIPYKVENQTEISDSLLKDARDISDVLTQFVEFCKDSILISFDADNSYTFLKKNLDYCNIDADFTCIDVLSISRTVITKLAKFNIQSISKQLSIPVEKCVRALDKSAATHRIYKALIKQLRDNEINTFKALEELTRSSNEKIRKMKSYHIILIAKNETGRVNLYRLVSESHLNYYYKHARIPKSVLNKYREGIIVGSACEAGELFKGVLDGKTDEELSRIVDYYDYLEIQPIGNNAFLIASEDYPNIKTNTDLQNLNRRIVKLGMTYNKPVCATCDVHFLNPEDEIYRRVIMAGKGFKDADTQAPLYLRTTEEMLSEFEYLGSDKAEEVVITNTNLVASWCEKICPIHPDKCPPVIPNDAQTLRTICETRAHEIYGDVLPPVVEERLERELNSIIGNGFAVMYIIAQKLVWKSNEDGYLVGSRGSVGSSFVATMAGITEVNPLVPHYYCTNCYYSDFESEDVKMYAGRAGCDMPDKNCPVCNAPLKKDGFDIPFETFLGFKGDKEPDIDLNFSGEYQSKAHKYTEVIFGAGQTFRAGTIGTLADKTAFGYVKKYFEEKSIPKRTCEINRIVSGCVDVRRTTGQHPGGIIVLPLGYDINQFTPVQHPADDNETDIITTHFDYHSIDHNLLKLDILGHDDPTIIRMLQDLTGMDPLTIPLDDKGVMSLFDSTDILGITPEDIGGCKLGCLGIPEFGTDFVIQMLLDTKPKSFSDLIRISGLSHGTDVWLGNAQTLIEEGKATISTAICTRDDIMTYLIGMGLDPGMSFSIMENVRKGKVAGGKCKQWPEWREEMVKHNVPDWYIWSCEKIKYMFPKAHAAAYVMMAWRIAYCKVYYPLAYYSAYFSIRAKAFNYELMCQGREHLEIAMESYKKREDSLSNKEQDELSDMKLVQEMYARGFEFMPIDLKRVNPRDFQIIDNKIMPALCSVEGIAEKAAEYIVEAAKGEPFLSVDDFKERSKASTTICDTLYELGMLGDIPRSNQFSLFGMID